MMPTSEVSDCDRRRTCVSWLQRPIAPIIQAYSAGGGEPPERHRPANCLSSIDRVSLLLARLDHGSSSPRPSGSAAHLTLPLPHAIHHTIRDRDVRIRDSSSEGSPLILAGGPLVSEQLVCSLQLHAARDAVGHWPATDHSLSPGFRALDRLSDGIQSLLAPVTSPRGTKCIHRHSSIHPGDEMLAHVTLIWPENGNLVRHHQHFFHVPPDDTNQYMIAEVDGSAG
ncbi:hypothetical protein BO94DRAFT_339268 [Aspergillus sclerotioniger CBS 115572]|uniref:Uncharacterized protein n=1 Tax=Aspergillus sclerotioniger CBS 115572 TaxID=1450535 RepID=A0A317UVC6_9EURO|nr:hypothetical protein BO94DRAFT_339268 [Aspergillus sclerotioniger CBS 115572]PWY65359.1 hypothetical protein BO94DRAFT_339268 [Aspergillus sclerotioniger CBS 115572]